MKAFIPIAVLLLAGCSLFEAKEPVIDKSKRLSVLQLETKLAADDAASTTLLDIPEVSSNTDWIMSGAYPDHVLAHLELPGPVSLAWKQDIGKGARRGAYTLPQPVVSNGKLITMDTQGRVSAYDTENGNRLWRNVIRPEYEEDTAVPGGMVFASDTIYISTGYGDLFALNAEDGAVKWQKKLPAPASSAPTLSQGKLFLVTVDSELLAIDTKAGMILWRSAGGAEITSIAGGASPAVSGRLVLAPYASGELAALDANNGTLLWLEPLVSTNRFNAVAGIADIVSPPVIYRGAVLAASHGGNIVAVDARSGKRVWTVNAGSTGYITIADNGLYVVTNNNELICIMADGRIRWVTQLAKYENEKRRSGPLTWFGPLLVDNRIMVMSSKGVIQYFSPDDGSDSGRNDLDQDIATQPIIADKTMYVVTRKAKVLALRQEKE